MSPEHQRSQDRAGIIDALSNQAKSLQTTAKQLWSILLPLTPEEILGLTEMVFVIICACSWMMQLTNKQTTYVPL